jgi:hypothetical protein
LSAAEIHRELHAVYGQNVRNEGTVRQWFKLFKDGRKMFTMKSEVVCLQSAVSDDLVQNVDQKSVKVGISQIQNFRVNLHKFHALFFTRL